MSKAGDIAKRNAGWCCQKCGSSKFIQEHHQIPGDDSSIIILCGECHSAEHPNVPKGIFVRERSKPRETINFYSDKRGYLYCCIPKFICDRCKIDSKTEFRVYYNINEDKLVLEQV